MRKRQTRNFCRLLMISNGIPMIMAGDEFLRMQKGNNNPYNQDNEVSGVDWSFREKHQISFRFFKKGQDIIYINTYLTASRSVAVFVK